MHEDRRLQLAPSILTADFGRLVEGIQAVAQYIDWIHLDVMDGHYVPNITFGPSIVEAIDRVCELPLHVHLMIEEPRRYVREFVDAGADRISFHPEVPGDPADVIAEILAAGAAPGIAIHPDVPVSAASDYLDDLDVILMMTVRPGFGGQQFMHEVVPKIAEARELVDQNEGKVEVEVDGGVNLRTVEAAVEAGGDILVAGSAIFDGVDPAAAARAMRGRLDELAARSGP